MRLFLQTKINKVALFFIAGLFYFTTPIFSQNFVWAKQLSGSGSESGNSIYVDASGNVYTTGAFGGTVDFDPGVGVFTLTATAGADIFISKLDASGNFVWAKAMEGNTGINVGRSITVDALGNILTTGSFKGTVDFDPGSGTFTLGTVSGGDEIFVSKLDGLGNFVWAKAMEGANQGLGYSITVDASGNVYTTGSFRNTVDFDPGVAVFNLASPVFPGVFISKLDASGNFVWAKQIGGANGSDSGRSIETDAAGDVYTTGYFNGTADFDPNAGVVNLTSAGSTDIFISKLDAAGNFVWAKIMGGTNTDQGYSVKLDASGNIYTTGIFNGTGDFDPGASVFNLLLVGSNDIFISKLDASGNFVWAKSIGSTNSDVSNSIDVDIMGNVYTTGSFAGTADFDPGVGVLNLSPSVAGIEDVFISKLNAAGNFVWAKAMGGASTDIGNSIAVDVNSSVFTTGSFNGIVDFDPNASTFNLTSASEDVFVHKICQLPSMPVAISGTSTVCFGATYIYSVAPVVLTTSYTWGLPTGWSGTSATNIINATPGSSGTLLITANNACGSSPIQTLSVTVLPANVNPGSNFNLFCKQKQVINAACTPSLPTSVVWTPTTGLNNSAVLTPTASGTGSNIQYTVTVNLNNGCIVTSTLNVSNIIQTPDICQVTVDSLGVDNEIYWEKTLYPSADSFIVYREVSTNVYSRIGGVSRTALSMYVDTNRSIGPANGNPNLTYYKYKLQIKDSCNNVSPMSLWHETIFIQDQMNGNFNWNMYSIEGTTATPVSNYNLKRRDVATGTETLVTSTTGGLASDPLYNSFWPLNVKWFVDAVGFSCNATAKYDPNNQTMVIKNKTRSNQSNDKLATGIMSQNLVNTIRLYPNPASDILNVDLNGLEKTETTVEIRNMLGQLIYQTKALNQYLAINTGSISNGVYSVNILQNNKTISVKKIVVEK